MVLKPALSLSNINYHIGSHQILQGVSLDIPQGCVFGLLGPNGAGKSTLLNAISGLIHVDGDIYWRDSLLNKMSPQHRAKQLAVVHQINQPIFALSAKQVVKMGLLPHQSLLSSVSKAEHTIIADALHTVGLADKADQPFNALSGGEQQRCLIARALVQQAPLFVLDEPVNHLDIYYQHQILALLRHLAHQQGKTVVVSLHDLNLAATYCDNVGVLQRGQLRASGSPKDVLSQALIEHVYGMRCDIKHNQNTSRIHIEYLAEVSNHEV